MEAFEILVFRKRDELLDGEKIQSSLTIQKGVAEGKKWERQDTMHTSIDNMRETHNEGKNVGQKSLRSSKIFGQEYTIKSED